MTCTDCQTRASSPTSGRYNLRCLPCCTALVASTHPLRHHAQAMLAAIARVPWNPGRAQVLESVRRCLEKRP